MSTKQTNTRKTTRTRASRTKAKQPAPKRTTKKRTSSKPKKDVPSPPENMIERAKRETALYLGRRKTKRMVKPFNGIRVETVVAAIYASYGIAATVAKMLGAHVTSIHEWKKTHEWMRDAFDEARELMLDIAESSLLSAVTKEEGWATCFILKCRGKERGYVEKLVLGGSLDGTLTVNLGGADGDQDTVPAGIN